MKIINLREHLWSYLMGLLKRDLQVHHSGLQRDTLKVTYKPPIVPPLMLGRLILREDWWSPSGRGISNHSGRGIGQPARDVIRSNLSHPLVHLVEEESHRAVSLDLSHRGQRYLRTYVSQVFVRSGY